MSANQSTTAESQKDCRLVSWSTNYVNNWSYDSQNNWTSEDPIQIHQSSMKARIESGLFQNSKKKWLTAKGKLLQLPSLSFAAQADRQVAPLRRLGLRKRLCGLDWQKLVVQQTRMATTTSKTLESRSQSSSESSSFYSDATATHAKPKSWSWSLTLFWFLWTWAIDHIWSSLKVRSIVLLVRK